MGGRVTPCLVVLSTFSLPISVPPCGHHNSFYTIFLPTPKPLSAGRHQKFPQLHLCWVWKKEGTCETFESLLCCCFLCLAYTIDIHIIYTLRYMYITRTSDLRFLSWNGKTFNCTYTLDSTELCLCFSTLAELQISPLVAPLYLVGTAKTARSTPRILL